MTDAASSAAVRPHGISLLRRVPRARYAASERIFRRDVAAHCAAETQVV
jgi:hypothetical protein